jgi:hypothetical protein
LCAGVTFEIDGDVTPIQFCHAERCRKASGAGFAAHLLARIDGFRWTSGRELVGEYEAPILKRPPAYRVAFCRTCGSPLPVQLDGTPLMILSAGVLDDDPATRPFQHVFVAEKANWHEIVDTLPQFDAEPPPPPAEWNVGND